MGSVLDYLKYVPQVVSAYQALTGGRKSNNNLNAATEQQKQLTQAQLDLIQRILPVYQAAIQQAQAPAYANIQSPYTDAMDELRYRPYADEGAVAAGNAVDALRYDLATNGIRGGTGFDTGAALIRRGEGTANANFRRNLRYQGGVQRYTDAKAAEDTRMQRLVSLLPSFLGTSAQAGSNIGGAMNVWGNLSNQYANSLAGSIAAASNVYAAGKGPNAGDNRSGTNQVGQNPFNINASPQVAPVQNVPMDPYAVPGTTYIDESGQSVYG